MKKVIIKFSGGFGNQLFQYSLAKHLELDKKFNIIPDFNFFRTYKLHKNYIQKIGFKENNLKLHLSSSFFPNKLYPVSKIYLQFVNSCKFIKENENLNFINLNKYYCENLYLDGYWQNIKYFYKSAEKIKYIINNFLRQNTKKNSNVFKYNKKKNNYVMVHLRFKDYKKKKNLMKHGLLDENYYLKSIKLLNGLKKNNKFIIFSDEISSAKKKLGFLKNKIFFDKKSISDPITTMYYMTKCNDFIISNSTFSWWAAYLSKNQNKNVICPDKWFVSKKFNKISYEKKWIKI